MQLGEVIHKYRKEKNMTQEEMANRLGVTAPAVNKWEKGVTQPDIMLLAPIARLLGITLETLLSFHEELGKEELEQIIREIDAKFEQESYESVFAYAQSLIRQYPNCEQLIWQLAVILDARQMMDETMADDRAEAYEEQILTWYQRALESSDAKIQKEAAGSLFQYYSRKEAYDKAQEYLQYFVDESTEKKQLQAQLYEKTGRRQEAYKTYEEILFSEYQIVYTTLAGLYTLSMEVDNIAGTRKYIDKLSRLAELFEMGAYYEVSVKLELTVKEKDVSETLAVVRQMLASLEQTFGYKDTFLYSHMKFKDVDEGFVNRLRENLLKCFRDKETFAYMAGNEEWEALVGEENGK